MTRAGSLYCGWALEDCVHLVPAETAGLLCGSESAAWARLGCLPAVDRSMEYWWYFVRVPPADSAFMQMSVGVGWCCQLVVDTGGGPFCG